MAALESLAQQVEWTAGNFAYNLGFIPEDKLQWKPAPTAPSALEIVQHLVEGMEKMRSLLQGGSYEAQVATPQTRDESQKVIRQAASDYAAMLRQIAPHELDDEVVLPWGEHTVAEAAGMEAIDLIHHHGQITYIQMLLGDETSHFEMLGT